MAMPFLQEELYSAQQPGERLISVARRRPTPPSFQFNKILLTKLHFVPCLLQPCSCWTTTWRSTCGRAGSPTTRSAQARPRSAGITSENAPWRQYCSTAKVETNVQSAHFVCVESLASKQQTNLVNFFVSQSLGNLLGVFCAHKRGEWFMMHKAASFLCILLSLYRCCVLFHLNREEPSPPPIGLSGASGL